MPNAEARMDRNQSKVSPFRVLLGKRSPNLLRQKQCSPNIGSAVENAEAEYARMPDSESAQLILMPRKNKCSILTLAKVAAVGCSLLFLQNITFYQTRNLSTSAKILHQGGHPVVYTFCQKMEPDGYDGDDLDRWEILWREAGWEPKVLSIKDAKRHPDYAQYEHDLRNVPLGPKPEFDKMNFLRYLAMAAVGGGLMADVDVFPLWPLDDERDGGRFQNAMSNVLDTSLDDATADLPFNGKFSLLCGGPGSEVPCLMSGTASQWSHVANVLLENGRRHIFSDHWSDMKALQEILHQDVMPAHQVIAKTFDGTSVVQWLTSDEDDWTRKCVSGQSMASVHFSPHSMTSNVHQEYWQSSKKYLICKQIAMSWMAKWGERCLDENSSYRKYLMWQKPAIDVAPLLRSSAYAEGGTRYHSSTNITYESIEEAAVDEGMIHAEIKALSTQTEPDMPIEEGLPTISDVQSRTATTTSIRHN